MQHHMANSASNDYTVTDIEVISDAWGERRNGEVIASYDTLEDARYNAEHLRDLYLTEEPEHTHIIIINFVETGEFVDEYVAPGNAE